MEKSNKRDRLRGLLGTVMFHCILLAAFLFLGLRTPLPLPEEEGIEVRLGDMDGMGEITFTPPPAYVPPTPSNPEKVKEEFITQNTNETPKIVENTKPIKNENPIKTETVVKEEVKEPVVNTNLLFKPSNKTGQNQGETDKPGYQGNPNGNPNSGNPTGSLGDGVSFNLNGRSTKYLPKPEYNSPEQGTVVVEITVDKYGNVIYARAGAKGSTTSDATLKELATKAAYKAKFDVNLNALNEQKGTITYKFIRLN